MLRADRERPLVSVIVPVRDNAAGVRELMNRLDVQQFPRELFEVVIGDDGSSDNELQCLETADGRRRVVRRPPRTSYAARNAAAHAARGEILAFCDSDCLPEPDWLEHGVAALRDAEIVAGEVTFAAPPRPTCWSLLTIDMFLDQERAALQSKAVTANLFVRRRDFDALGGFDESLPSGGDFDFVQRAAALGARVSYAPKAVVRHPTLDRRGDFLKKVRLTNRWDSARKARGGYSPSLKGAVTFIPFVGVAVARRKAMRSPRRLHRGRLQSAGAAPGRLAELRAVSALYMVVGFTAGLARLAGWFEGRRLARAQAIPMLPGSSPPSEVISPPSGEPTPAMLD